MIHPICLAVALAAAPNEATDYIKVEILGTPKTGIFAIGGETTGTTITANGITWELEFPKAMLKQSQKLDGRKVIVKGTLERREGIEIKERWIVKVSGIQAAGEARVE